jgi:hypothetical protein
MKRLKKLSIWLDCPNASVRSDVLKYAPVLFALGPKNLFKAIITLATPVDQALEEFEHMKIRILWRSEADITVTPCNRE